MRASLDEFRAAALAIIAVTTVVVPAVVLAGGPAAGQVAADLRVEGTTDVDGDGRTGPGESTDGDAVYGSIGDAVGNATTGDRVVVEAGVYEETNVTVPTRIELVADGTVVADATVADNGAAGVFVGSGTAADGVTVRRSVLSGNADAGVEVAVSGVVDARNNYWGAPSGPASAGNATLSDPVNDTVVADGGGGAITAGATAGIAAVRFDPFLASFGSSAVTNNTAAFDFNGDGQISIVDVSVLLAES